MNNFGQKPDTANKNHGKNKKIVAAVSVAVAVVAMIIVFFAAKNNIFFSLALYQAENGNYKSAVSLAENSDLEGAETLKNYAILRIEINKYFPLLLSDFNLEKIEAWSVTAQNTDAKSYLLSDTLSAEILELNTTLSQIIRFSNEYAALKSDILDMMDVFAEINRLHTKDSEGKNISFTVAEERAKISRWSEINNRMLSFVAQAPRCENIYLANFLAKEARGEIAEFEETINGVAATYDDTSLVRFSGDVFKQYPDITNSDGQKVNLLEKEKFEDFMCKEIYTELVRCLSGFYSA